MFTRLFACLDCALFYLWQGVLLRKERAFGSFSITGVKMCVLNFTELGTSV